MVIAEYNTPYQINKMSRENIGMLKEVEIQPNQATNRKVIDDILQRKCTNCNGFYWQGNNGFE